jgi:hypothetical protein
VCYDWTELPDEPEREWVIPPYTMIAVPSVTGFGLSRSIRGLTIIAVSAALLAVGTDLTVAHHLGLAAGGDRTLHSVAPGRATLVARVGTARPS